jgi:hypothetical protein
MADKITPDDNQVNIGRIECDCMKWIPHGSETLQRYVSVNTVMDASFSWKEENQAPWL